MDLFDIAVASKLAGGGGGGASKIVTGEFTTNTESGVQEITIPYEGNGYPVNIYIMSESFDIGSRSDVAPTASICIKKKDSTVAPKYTEASDDEVDMYEIHRYTATNKTRLFYAETLGSINFFSQNDTTQTAWTRVRMSAKNKLKIFTTGIGSNRNGFLSDATYTYTIEYSS